ncbi:MAG: hypothetical protein RL660_738 [Bacteroidota bacterium]|jgi:predicted AAA+ superfamily ATPase
MEELIQIRRYKHLDMSYGDSYFLWGVRQVGKSTMLNQHFPDAMRFDLLESDLFRRLLSAPELFRERILASPNTKLVIVDEIQKLPILLDEVHWLIENKRIQFILTGSSPRKIVRQGVNLLGGRAIRTELLPLSFIEIPNFNLLKALNDGLMPKHYLSTRADRLIGSYIGAYLQDEIIAEAQVREVAAFSRFLDNAAFSNAEILSYTNIATECGIKATAVKAYFNILVDTMIGNFVEPFQKAPKRRVVGSPKFYFFDVGICNYLLKRRGIEYGTVHFGTAFEHFIYMELKAYITYNSKNYPIRYWRTTSGFEVDFIIGDAVAAIEVKGAKQINSRHLKGLTAFAEEYSVQHKIVVCLEDYARLVNDTILVLPWQDFLQRLWKGELF